MADSGRDSSIEERQIILGPQVFHSLRSAVQDIMSSSSARTRPSTNQNTTPFRSLHQPIPFSRFSSPPVPDRGWAAENFMIGAGMIIIQNETHKIVVVNDTKYNHWFLPKGRKDIGESLETTALREAYEESGYQVGFLPLWIPTRAPSPPNDRDAHIRPNTEPVYVSLMSWRPRGRRPGGEYLTFWYVGQIPKDAVYTPGTGMPDEQTYASHLFEINDALAYLSEGERSALLYAWNVYCNSWEIEQRAEEENDVEETAAESN